MNPLWIPVVLPILLGLVCLPLPRRLKIISEMLALAGSLGSFIADIWLFGHRPLEWVFKDATVLQIDALCGFIVLASGLLGIVITLYSLRFMKNAPRVNAYYAYLLITLGSTNGVLLSNHFIYFLSFWGVLGITLYLMILMGGEDAASPAKKTLLLVGGSDTGMLLGIALMYHLTSTLDMRHMGTIPLEGLLAYTAFFALVIGAFVKAGAMPFHVWIPDAAETAPIPVTAYLPAALDKLLGIYLLSRVCLSWFSFPASTHLFFMIVGTLTILAAVMMALIQHDVRRLLAYHAVSQVGYMVLGIGTGNPIGIAGGLFHMLNNSIYKACLFLTGGAVQYRTGQTDLDHLGGLGRSMPLTCACFLVAALSISGVPPFNGFVSKWMIYQGLLVAGQQGDTLWILWLAAALFGSALTLASFMKLAHGMFLGVPSRLAESEPVKEVGFGMAASMVILSVLCVLFGVFAFSLPLRYFILPSVPGAVFPGFWQPGTATILLLAGLVIGFCMHMAGNLKTVRKTDSFMGGEELPPEARITGSQFYKTIRDLPILHAMYAWAEARVFDVYDQGSRLAFWAAGILSRAHTGVLTMYMGWLIAGLVVLLIVLMRR